MRRINVSGNTRTRDEVVRREMRQFESAWYDGQRIKLSRDRVDRLGYFGEVDIDTQEVPGSQDQVDLTPDGQGKADRHPDGGRQLLQRRQARLHRIGQAGQRLRHGNYFGIELNTSRSGRTLVLSTVDPYFTNDGISRALDVFYRTNKPLNSSG